MYPIRFEPIYQAYLWGGDRIARKYGRNPSVHPVAESWEIADRGEGMSVAANGPYAGKGLNELVQELGEELVGKGQKFERFPLLVKILDAKEPLSLQVHPDETAAALLKGEPKSEMWYALDSGAVLAGFAKGAEEEEFLQALAENRAESYLEKIDLEKGDAVYIPGGRVHAVCAGSLLFEVQQNSNTTYRLSDWGRKDKNGKSRELHLKEARQAIRWHDRQHAKLPPHHFESDAHHQLVSVGHCPYFAVDRYDFFDRGHIAPIPKTFQILFFLEGEGTLSAGGHREPFRPGMTFLTPAVCPAVETEGKCQLLRIRLP